MYKYRHFVHDSVTTILPLDDYPDYYDITFVTKGELNYLINGIEYKITPGNAIFIAPGDHRVRLLEENVDASHYSINFFYHDDLPIELPHFIGNCITPHILHSINLIEDTRLSISVDYWEELFDNSVSIIIYLLKNICKQNTMNPYLKIMLEYISLHFQEHITLEDVAQSVNLTPTYCCHIFKNELNTTIYDTIMKERVLLAKNFITSGEYKLYEVAQLCGFNDYTHFSKYFKKSTGYLPSEYKKIF